MRRFKPTTLFLLLILAFLLTRGAILNLPDIIDPTEGRYALISKHLLAQGSWVMPEIDRGDGFVPFWGKPPMFFWLTAGVMEGLGSTTVAARLVSFVSSILILIFTYVAARVAFSVEVALLAVAMLATTLTFFGLAGSCTIDVLLTLGITGALSSLLVCIVTGKKAWGWLGFLFMALAMMTKGPIGVIFILAPLLGWSVVRLRFDELRALPWISGLLLFGVTAAPWFYLAERASPGFLYYFFVNEHVLRFTSRDYGDKYGSSHPSWKGKIWLLAIGGFLPWVIAWLPRYSGLSVRWFLTIRERRWELFFLLWFLAPLVFFSIAGTVLFTYALPAFPPATILLSRLLTVSDQRRNERFFNLTRSIELFSYMMLLAAVVTSLVLSLPVAWIAAALCLVVLAASVSLGRERTPAHAGVRAALIFLSSLSLGLCTISELVSDLLSAEELIIEAKQADPVFNPVFVGKLPYSASFVSDFGALKKIGYEELSTAPISGDYIFSSRKRVDLRLASAAKTICMFGHWVYLDMDNAWSCPTESRMVKWTE